MARILILISSGTGEKERALAGIMLARNLKAREIVEDVRVIFFGPSEKALASGDRDFLEQYKLLANAGIVASACVAIADSEGISNSLKDMGLILEPVSIPIARYASEGYQILTF
ncbi:MAG: DsrE family protein [Candidatus Thermoplasmatota archaeon]|nr:DsrE family protein [Candidatus Thermoplasmatota archaeon]MCL5665735.1 DsrE family protein [Candidatus Thermoplasmatota archaeon]